MNVQKNKQPEWSGGDSMSPDPMAWACPQDGSGPYPQDCPQIDTI